MEQESKLEPDEYLFMSLMEGQPAVETIWRHRNKVVASVFVRETFYEVDVETLSFYYFYRIKNICL